MDEQDRQATTEEEMREFVLSSPINEKEDVDRFVDLLIDLIAERSEEKAEERVDQHERDYDHDNWT